VLFIGDDWAEDHHDLEIEDQDGHRLARARLPEGLEGITRLHALVAGHAPAVWADPPTGAGCRSGGRRYRDRPWPVGHRVARSRLSGVRDQPTLGSALTAAAHHLGGKERRR